MGEHVTMDYRSEYERLKVKFDDTVGAYEEKVSELEEKIKGLEADLDYQNGKVDAFEFALKTIGGYNK